MPQVTNFFTDKPNMTSRFKQIQEEVFKQLVSQLFNQQYQLAPELVKDIKLYKNQTYLRDSWSLLEKIVDSIRLGQISNPKFVTSIIKLDKQFAISLTENKKLHRNNPYFLMILTDSLFYLAKTLDEKKHWDRTQQEIVFAHHNNMKVITDPSLLDFAINDSQHPLQPKHYAFRCHLISHSVNNPRESLVWKTLQAFQLSLLNEPEQLALAVYVIVHHDYNYAKQQANIVKQRNPKFSRCLEQYCASYLVKKGELELLHNLHSAAERPLTTYAATREANNPKQAEVSVVAGTSLDTENSQAPQENKLNYRSSPLARAFGRFNPHSVFEGDVSNNDNGPKIKLF